MQINSRLATGWALPAFALLAILAFNASPSSAPPASGQPLVQDDARSAARGHGSANLAGSSGAVPQGRDDENFSPIHLKYSTFTPPEEPAVPATLAAAADDPLRLVQMRGPLAAEEIEALDDAGAQILGYIPEFTYLARVPAEIRSRVQGLPFVLWVGPFHPAYKIQGGLLDAASGPAVRSSTRPAGSPASMAGNASPGGAATAGSGMPGPALPASAMPGAQSPAAGSAEIEVNILYFAERSPADGSKMASAGGLDERTAGKGWGRTAAGEVITAEIQRLGGQITHQGEGHPILRARLAPDSIAALARLPEVRWIDRWDPPVVQMDHIRPATGATTAHTGGFDGAGIVGEVKDAGIDQLHPDFGNLIGTFGGPGVDAHGTCTFGIVFSDGTESAQALGMMPAGGGVFCDWYVERNSSIANLVDTWGGVFQSNSWSQGDSNGVYSSYSEEDDAAIVEHDAMMLYAAGNYGTGAQTITQDAAGKNVVAVGAVFHQNTETLADDQWENHGWGSTPSQGPADDGRIKPDLCAFFDQIYTTDVRGGGGYSSGNYTSDFGGTSGATPIAAGAAGLVYQMYKENHFGDNPSGLLPHAATVKALLIASAYQYAFTEATRYQQGWGLVQPGRVYEAGPSQSIVNGGHPLSTGQTWNTTVSRNGAEPLKISLVWNDEPGEASSSLALINDLDLRVTAPDGSTIYYGNQGLVSGLWSTAGGAFDRLNNVENVFIQSPADGPYTVEVLAYNVAMDNDPAAGVNQDFSLVAFMTAGGGSSGAMIVTGPGPTAANPPRVRTFDAADPSALVDEWNAYGVAQFGVNVACGDLDGSGLDAVITGPGPGAIFGPHVRGFRGDGTPLSGVSFLAYGTYKFGVNVAAGDLDGDGMAEIVTGAGPGAVFGPHVRGWNVDGGAAAAIPGVSFLAYGTNKWGVNVACGDIDGDGNDEIVTGAGPGAVFGPHVRGWNVDGGAATAIPAVSFFAYGTHKFGVNVACGDLDGDGMDEILTGPGPGGMFGAQVRGWNYDGVAVTPLAGVSFTAYAGALNGVRVAAADVDGDGVDEILTMPGPDPAQPARARGWNVDGGTATPITTIDFDAYGDLGLTRGGRIAGGSF